MPADPVPPYTSYLLRVWRIQEQGQSACRALLEAIATGQRWGFDNRRYKKQGFRSSPQRALAMSDSQVVQSGRCFHESI